MGHPRAAWGIEIGAYALKALRLEREGDAVSVSDFAYIPHKKVLTTPDLDADEMTRLTLGQFISQKTLEGEHLVVSVPGHSAFARFAKLPPVEPKKVPDIVKFEAVQQIPFPIEEVEWDYQTFTEEDSPEVEVGIFAITREKVQHMLGVYGDVGMSPEALTLSPVSVYNSVAYDHAESADEGPVLYLDIGTSATDVVVAEEGRVWIRTFPLGGTHFTEAIANAFKLSYGKAEKLKLEASSSKYAKQIMQAMRPVFSDLLQDLQRSIGYYQSLHRDKELKLMVGLGSTFKIPGLRKFLGQQLQMDVVRLDEYKRITVTGREAAQFAEATVNMATAYGLALQGVGLAQIDANLVPVSTLREQMWHQKTKWFGAAAAIVILAAGSMLIRPLLDRSSMEATVSPDVNRVITTGKRFKGDIEQLQSQSKVGSTVSNLQNLLDYRDIWPHLVHDASDAVGAANPQDALLTGTPEAIMAIPPRQRRLIELERLSGEYLPPAAGSPRKMQIVMEIKLTHDRWDQFVNTTVAKWLRDNAEPTGARADVPYRIVADSVSFNPQQVDTTTVDEDGDTGSLGATPSQPRPRPGAQPVSGGNSMSPAPMSRAGGGAPPPPSMGGIGAEAVGRDGSTSSGSRPSRSGGFGQRPSTGPIDLTGFGGEDAEREAQALNEIAPIPGKPDYYPAGAKIYRVPVTFEIELLDADAEMPAPDNATASTDGDTESAA